MAYYRKKPVVVEVHEWTGTTRKDALQFHKDSGFPLFDVGEHEGQRGLIIPTLEGTHVALKGDYIVTGVKGEFYPVKPDIFHETYEAVEEVEREIK